MQILAGVCLGLVAWFLLRVLLMGVYTVDQNERAVKTRFGRAVRVPGGKTTLDDPVSEVLRPEERDRYTYPQVRVIPPRRTVFQDAVGEDL
jgi:regulator of protease activity HflC (stomatin/prohibitin superfamily)